MGGGGGLDEQTGCGVRDRGWGRGGGKGRREREEGKGGGTVEARDGRQQGWYIGG